MTFQYILFRQEILSGLLDEYMNLKEQFQMFIDQELLKQKQIYHEIN